MIVSFRHTSQEQPGKEPAQEDNSLKKQMIKQDYSGAVAVMAIIHRPPSGAQPSSADPGSFIPSADSRTTAGGRTIAAAGIASQPATKDTAKAAVIDTPVQTQKPPQHRLQHGHHHPVFLHVANVGDCRGVLCRGGTAVPVTEDHTPSIPREAARVEGAGGFVSRGRVNGILGVSRSFGDIHCKVRPVVEIARSAAPLTSCFAHNFTMMLRRRSLPREVVRLVIEYCQGVALSILTKPDPPRSVSPEICRYRRPFAEAGS